MILSGSNKIFVYAIAVVFGGLKSLIRDDVVRDAGHESLIVEYIFDLLPSVIKASQFFLHDLCLDASS